jgi:DNA mismatch repair protein MutS
MRAQAGGFVPASRAQVPITDKILTRIGAQDFLSQGQSTFMVEMKETSDILACATPNSLILLDEIGRGTSTFDGISIAWAVAEFLHRQNGAGTKTLFATHYFELTELGDKCSGIKNFHVAASEYEASSGKVKLNFLFKIEEGAADRSYGIHVAELAGLPKSCILRAKKILKDLRERQNSGAAKEEARAPDLSSNPILEEIKLLDVDKITPVQALQILWQWKERVK